MQEDFKEEQNINEMGVTFYIMSGHKIALAELSIFPKEFAQDFINNSQTSQEDKKIINDAVMRSSNILFFNRLSVPKELRGSGLGTKLLSKLKSYLDESDTFLINTANSYGDKTQEELIAFYIKNHMKLIHSDGGLIYHKDLQKNEFSLVIKKSKKHKK